MKRLYSEIDLSFNSSFEWEPPLKAYCPSNFYDLDVEENELYCCNENVFHEYECRDCGKKMCKQHQRECIVCNISVCDTCSVYECNGCNKSICINCSSDDPHGTYKTMHHCQCGDVYCDSCFSCDSCLCLSMSGCPSCFKIPECWNCKEKLNCCSGCFSNHSSSVNNPNLNHSCTSNNLDCSKQWEYVDSCSHCQSTINIYCHYCYDSLKSKLKTKQLCNECLKPLSIIQNFQKQHNFSDVSIFTNK